MSVLDFDGKWRMMGATSVTVVPGTSEAWATGKAGLLHFNGRRWTRVPTPQPTDRELSLEAIYARASDDVWAVGWYRKVDESNYEQQPLIEHWDGHAWTIVPNPTVEVVDPDGDGAVLTDVVAVAADDAWAVGRHRYDDQYTTFVQHWDGSEWTTVPGSGLAPWNSLGPVGDRFQAVVSIPYSSTRWFLGNWSDEGGSGPLIQRYRDAWSSPFAPNSPGSLVGAAALRWDDVWAVGGGGPDGSAFAMHKDRASWSVVPTPAPPMGRAALRSVAGVSSTNVWAVGQINDGTTLRALVEHWDGSSWSIAPSPLDHGALRDIALRRSGWGWVVGDNAILQACGL
ncbi:MAG: hypothetical protein ACRDPC_00850 [Solirubrobacteraceae bacterium]